MQLPIIVKKLGNVSDWLYYAGGAIKYVALALFEIESSI